MTSKELIVREYVRLSVENALADIRSGLYSKYDKKIYSEKVQYTNSKEYRRKRKYSTGDDFSSALGYWTFHRRDGASNAPHISSGTNEGRVFNSGVELEGFQASITREEYIQRGIQTILSEIKGNEMVSMIKCCYENLESWQQSSCYEEFCNKYVSRCALTIQQQLQEMDTLLGIDKNRSYVRTPKGMYLYEDKITGNPFWSSHKTEIDKVEDECEVDAIVVESQKKAHFIIYTRIFPAQKALLGLKKDDTFVLPNIPCTYRLTKIMV